MAQQIKRKEAVIQNKSNLNPFIIYESQVPFMTEWEFWNCTIVPDSDFFNPVVRIPPPKRKELKATFNNLNLYTQRSKMIIQAKSTVVKAQGEPDFEFKSEQEDTERKEGEQ